MTSKKSASEEEKRKFEAEAKLAEAKTEVEAIVAKKHATELEAMLLDLQKKKQEHAEKLTLNKYHHIYDFDSSVSSMSVHDCISQLRIWERMEPGCPIEIIFSSPGGSVIDGMHLFDYIQGLKRKGHKITIGTLGMAASMAGILLQAGDHRWVGAEAYVLIHQIAGGAIGKIDEIKDEVKFMEKISDRVLTIFAARCAQAAKNKTATQPLTKRQLKRRWERKDWWLSSAECLKHGIVDEIR